MFFASTAAEYRRRTDALAGLNTADFADDGSGLRAAKGTPGDDGPATREQLAAAWRALPELDALVLTRKVGDVPSAERRAPPRLRVRTRHDTSHKYRCSDLR